MSDRSEMLYDGEVNLVFNDKKHAYMIGDKFVPGVTTILKLLNKPALVPWAANQCAAYVKANAKDGMTRPEIVALADDARKAYQRFTDEAADIGSMVHHYAEATMKGEEVAIPDHPAAIKGCNAFEEWRKSHEIKCLASEMMIFSRDMYYAGTADFYGYIDGELVVADFKTSSGIYPEMALQACAYQLAIEEEAKVQIAARWIIRLDKKTGAFEAKRFPHSEAHCEAWRTLRRLHSYMSKIEEEQKGK